MNAFDFFVLDNFWLILSFLIVCFAGYLIGDAIRRLYR